MKPRDGLRLHEDEHVGKGLEAFIVADMTWRPTTTGTEPDSGGFSEEPESFVGLPAKARFRLRQQIKSIDDKTLILHSSRMLVIRPRPRERRDGRLNRLDLTGTDSEIAEAFNDIADLNSGLKIELERVAMEACAPSHYWARELLAMGHDVRLIPPIYVKPYVKRGKNDAADAAAVCEAMSRPGMRFVPVKSEESQATLMLHKTRDLLIKQQTMSVNALLGHLAEFGIVAAKGIGRVDELIEKAENDASLPETAMAALRVFVQHLEAIDASIAGLDRRIASAHAQNEVSRLLVGIPGIGKITASAIVASVADPNVFKSGRDFFAWLGSTPRQNSSGGKEKLGSITKQGNAYIRRLLVLGATSLLKGGGKRKGALRDWIVALLARRPARLVTVALANKLARIIWAIMTTGEAFRIETFAKA